MGRKRKRGGYVKRKSKKIQKHEEPEELVKAPHSFVFKRGVVGRNILELVQDMRKVMEPFTAVNLKERNTNNLRDFISLAGPLGVTNLIIFSKTDVAAYVKICRVPRGPTLTFKLHQYCLVNDVIASLKKPVVHQKQFRRHPLVVLSNFGGEGMHLKLMATMFQNMFPGLNINKLKLASVRRCVLFSYDPETKCVEFRQYNIKAAPKDVSKPVKKLISTKIPNLGNLQDFSDYLTKDGNFSESEGEPDGPHNMVILPQRLPGRGGVPAHKSAIRLSELGPRMTLKLLKIEQGICNGEVLYHDYIKKRPGEVKLIEDQREQKRKLKEQRRKQQEINVAKKQKLKELHKKRSLQGMKRKMEETAKNDHGPSDSDDDAEWFFKETGVKPGDDLFLPRKKARIELSSSQKEFKSNQKNMKKQKVVNENERQTKSFLKKKKKKKIK